MNRRLDFNRAGAGLDLDAMKISVAIPCHNAKKFIAATLDSVLEQTAQPAEILVIDDGSSDGSADFIAANYPMVKLVRQENRGVAPTRCSLAAMAAGDLVACLDADDLWHPDYLKAHLRAFERHPDAVASYIMHENFEGDGVYDWKTHPVSDDGSTILVDPLEFMRDYNENTGKYSSTSFLCLKKSVLNALGPEPFKISAVEDSYIATLLPLHGPVVFTPAALGCYRLTGGSLSANRVKSLKLWVQVFETLEKTFATLPDSRMRREFERAYALRLRRCGKTLMGAGEIIAARGLFSRAAGRPANLVSKGKSLGLLLSTYMPGTMQPKWPPATRAGELTRAAASTPSPGLKN
jgi:hypothetical protein